MKYILGLDIGIASIGWAVVHEAENKEELSQVIASGTIKVDFDNFTYINEKGKSSDKGNPVELFNKGYTVSPNLVRRQSRSARRKLQRFKLRRADLIKLLQKNGFIDEDTALCEDGKNTTHETYLLRALAAKEEISLSDLAKVMLMINKKRGYKGGKKSDNSTEEDESAFLSAITDRSRRLIKNEQTVGQYLWSQLADHPLKSIKRQIFYRKDYEDEFEQIWKTQLKYHPELTRKLKKQIKNRVIFYQRPIESKKYAVGFCELESKQIEVEKNGKKIVVTTGSKVCPVSSPLFQEFRMWQRLNDVIVKHKVTLEHRPLTKEEKSLLASELSIRKEVTKGEAIKMLFKSRSRSYDLNFDKLIGNETQARLVNAYLSILEQSGHNKLDIKEMGAQIIKEAIKNVFKHLGYKTDMLDGRIVNEQEIYQQSFYRLWHLLYSFPGDNSRTGKETLVRRVKEFFDFDSDDYARLVANVTFPDGYGNLSAKAIQKILPKLKEGFQYSVACELVGYQHSKRSITNQENEERILQHHLDIIPHNSLRNPLVERILNQMIRLVNGLIEEYAPTYGSFDEIRIELARELRNNADQRRKLTKTIEENENERRTCRAELIAKLGEAGIKVSYVSDNDILKYRLYKELAKNGYKTLYSQTKVDLVELIMGRMFDKEHIIPKSKNPSNAFSVLTIELCSINDEKGDMTALDYVRWKYGEDAAQQYILRINDLFKQKAISYAKKENLLLKSADIPNEPLNRDLGLTQFINRKAFEILAHVSRKVVPTTGSITKRLREDWQLINVLQEVVWEKYEKLGLIDVATDKNGNPVKRINNEAWTKRTDHRNHAIDAITVAFTQPAFIYYLNSLNAESEQREQLMKMRQKYLYKDAHGNWRFNAPMPIGELRSIAKKQLENMIIAQRTARQVATPNNNITKSKKTKQSNKQTSLTPRGKLHDDTLYGRIQVIDDCIVDKSFDESKILTVTKEKYRLALLARFHQFGDDPKLAFTGKNSLDKSPIWMDEQHTARVPSKVKCKVIVFTKRVAVNEKLNVDNVVNMNVKKILIERLKEFDNNPKLAFSNLEDNPIWFNREKGICIKNVIVRTNIKEAKPIHKKHNHKGKVLLDKNDKEQPNDFVQTSNNHHVAIYEDANHDYHEDVVSFFDAVERARNNKPVINENFNSEKGWHFVFSMQKNDYFVFPDENTKFVPANINLANPDNYALVSPHIFRVQDISNSDYSFRHHTDATKKKDIRLKNVMWKRIRTPNDLKGIIKIRVNSIGKIEYYL